MVCHSAFRNLRIRRDSFKLMMTFRSLSSTTSENIVLTSKQGSLGVICLNNPSKLHALNLPMVQQISKGIVQMEADKDVSCILVKSNSPKAFCAGGDVQAVTSSIASKGTYYKDFFYNVSIVQSITRFRGWFL